MADDTGNLIGEYQQERQAVDDAARVCVRERVTNIEQDLTRERPIHAGDQALEAPSRGILHHEEGALAVEQAVIIHAHDPVVGEPCHGARFTREGVAHIARFVDVGADDLDGHLELLLAVVGQPHITHTAGADEPAHHEGTDSGARMKSCRVFDRHTNY